MKSSASINYLIMQVDRLIAQQLGEIIRNAAFLQLRASWIGLHYLVQQVSSKNNNKVRFLDVAWEELRRDLERSAAVEQSHLYDKIYSQEFGIAGGEPYGLLLADYELTLDKLQAGQTAQTLNALKLLADIAAASFAVIVINVKPELFGINSFNEISKQSVIKTDLNERNQISWDAFRGSENARFVCVVMPKVLMSSYYNQHVHQQRVYFNEDPIIWSNAIYSYAANFARSFANTGWFLDALGIPNDVLPSYAGMLPQLEANKFTSGLGDTIPKLLTEVLITAQQEQQLNAGGFTALSQLPQTPYAAFVNSPSLKLPFKLESSNLSGEELACSVIYTLSICRFAHYLKILGRQQIGKFPDAKACESYLQHWLGDYVTSNPDVPLELKYRYPLADAKVTVIKSTGFNEHYICLISLCPQLRTTHAAASVLLKTALLPLQ